MDPTNRIDLNAKKKRRSPNKSPSKGCRSPKRRSPKSGRCKSPPRRKDGRFMKGRRK